MKTLNVCKILTVVFCFSIFVSEIYAQRKTQSLKFDEFEVSWESAFLYYQNELSFTERAKRFGKQFRKERDAKAYIIFYLGRITEDNFYYLLTNKIDRFKREIRAENDYTNDNIVIINGGYREETTVEFWIVPSNAELPVSSPTLDKSQTFVCPKVYVYDRNLFNQPDTLMFSFSEYSLKEFPEYTFTWKIVGGEIIGDSKTSDIKVKLNEDTKRATAFVEINNLPFACPKVFSSTAEVNNKLFLIDDFGRLSNGDIKGRLDNLASHLLNNLTAKGFIINYGSRAEGKKYLSRRETLIRNHYNFRKFDTSRITFIDGGYREEEATSLWVSFDDAVKPIPTPTIDEKFVAVPKAKPKARPRRKSK